MRILIVAIVVLACGGCSRVERADSMTAMNSAAPSGTTREQLVNFVIAGEVVKVEDGDTLTLRGAGKQRFDIRMSDMDTPETFHSPNPYYDDPSSKKGACIRGKTKLECDLRCPSGPVDAIGQRYGKAAGASLATLAPVGAQARAECYEMDRYGRAVCHVFIGATNLNLEQIRRGWGMIPSDKDHTRDPESRIAETAARQAKLGVWVEANPVHPEAWRKDCWCEANDCKASE